MAQSIMLIKKAANASAIPIWDSVAGTLRLRIALNKWFLLTHHIQTSFSRPICPK